MIRFMRCFLSTGFLLLLKTIPGKMNWIRIFLYQHKLVKMGIRPNPTSLDRRRFWQRLVGAAAIYALIMPPLLRSFVGAQLSQASVLDGFSLSQLCLHATDSSPLSPSDPDKHPANHHCDLC